MSKTLARLALESPHETEYRASITAVASKAAPRGLHRLMVWFLTEWAAEVPDRLHKGEVWRSYKKLDEFVPTEHMGGSLLGSPATAGAFRAYLEDGPFNTDKDGHYVRPMHAALAKVCGRQGHEGETAELQPAPFMARFLFRLATTADLEAAASSMGIPSQVQHVYAEQALYRLWRTYEVGPGAMERIA